MARHVKRGDEVMITAGDHKGTVGEVMSVDPKTDRVFIKGVNLRTRHVRPTRVNPQGGIVTKEAPIHISNVSPVSEGRATRVRFRVNDDGSKERIAAATGESLGRLRGPRNGSAEDAKKDRK